MKIGNFAIAAGVMALGLATLTTPAIAQGPMYDRVNVDLPYTVTIGDHTLQPGAYVIQQLRGEGGSRRVLLIYSDNGMKFETSAMTIPALDQSTPEDTKVVLHHYGPEYYFDKIWIQGKNYGYEFPLPDSVKARERERMQPISVAAQYQATPAETQSATAQSTETTTTVAPVTPPPSESETTTTMAQNTPPAEVTPAAPPQENTANREMADNQAATTTTTDNTHTMPATSAGWLMMLLGGGALSGAGLMLRRKQ